VGPQHRLPSRPERPQLGAYGSDAGGHRAAAVYTLIETCKMNDVDPQAWLADVLARLPDYPAHKVAELLPWNWKANPAAQARRCRLSDLQRKIAPTWGAGRVRTVRTLGPMFSLAQIHFGSCSPLSGDAPSHQLTTD
jgi:hypothetical protein